MVGTQISGHSVAPASAFSWIAGGFPDTFRRHSQSSPAGTVGYTHCAGGRVDRLYRRAVFPICLFPETAVMIEISQVSFSYDQRTVLKDISFTVEEGERVAIIGPNGAGKSTLLRLISGLLKPGAGYIHITSGDYVYQPHKFNRRLAARLVAVVPQRAPQNVDFTVEELILAGRYSRSSLLGYSASDQKIVQSTIERCGLSGFQPRRLNELSGGELKRAMIARALVQEAPIVLLDEPTTDLDLRYQEEILQLVKGETGEKHLLIAVLHDLVLASRHFPRTIILSDGQLQADGKTSDVLSSQNITRAFNIDVEAEWWHGQLVLVPK